MNDYVPAPPSRMRVAARDLENIAMQMGMLAELIDAVEERIGDHHGGDITVNGRAIAMLVATAHLLSNARVEADALILRMLDAGQV